MTILKINLINQSDEITKILERMVLKTEYIDNKPLRMAANLITTILELHKGVLLLIKNDSGSLSAIFIRSIQESFIKLKCLTDNNHFINQIYYEDAVESQKLYTDMLEIFGEDDPDYENLQLKLNELNEIIISHTKNGIKRQTIIEKFELAGIKEQYANFRMFSSATHSSATELFARHGWLGQGLEFQKELPIITLISLLNQSFIYLINSIELLPKFSKADPTAIADEIKYIYSKYTFPFEYK